MKKYFLLYIILLLLTSCSTFKKHQSLGEFIKQVQNNIKNRSYDAIYTSMAIAEFDSLKVKSAIDSASKLFNTYYSGNEKIEFEHIGKITVANYYFTDRQGPKLGVAICLKEVDKQYKLSEILTFSYSKINSSAAIEKSFWPIDTIILDTNKLIDVQVNFIGAEYSKYKGKSSYRTVSYGGLTDSSRQCVLIKTAISRLSKEIVTVSNRISAVDIGLFDFPYSDSTTQANIIFMGTNMPDIEFTIIIESPKSYLSQYIVVLYKNYIYYLKNDPILFENLKTILDISKYCNVFIKEE